MITASGGAAPPRFTLWREVLMAYLAPALMAGAGGVASAQPDLTIAACTSIAGTSAVVATLIGSWLQRRGTRGGWLTTAPRIVPTVALAIAAAAVGALVAWLVTGWTPGGTTGDHGSWPDRLRLDLPLSSALAAGIITWRWRGAHTTRRAQR
ncbi:hypothetical protein ACIGXA_22360 [Streptomyces fildesensis]|uniref:Integral membrane protein n=1 Tax=Streptomyces fildesensis TaxID=375757 RepID=A0ABW8C9Z7_9ACTN